MLSTETLAAWLRCPQCYEDLRAEGTFVLGCANKHRYDANKRGYVNLVRRPDAMQSDSPTMLDARDQILSEGLYAPIANRVTSAITRSSGLRVRTGDTGPTVLDAGCGTGYYLRAVLDDMQDETARGLAMDLSPAAVQRAVRGRSDLDGLVADTWQSWPIRDSSATVILDIFAPRNFAEFHRVLAAAGILVLVFPTPHHLAELQDQGAIIGIEADKKEHVLSAASRWFELESYENVAFTLAADQHTAALLRQMGPSAHHLNRLSGSKPAATVDVPLTRLTASVDLLVFRRRQ